MSDLMLREATDADAYAISMLVRAAFEEYRLWLVPPSGAHGDTPERVSRRIAAGGALVALHNEQIIGCVFYSVCGDCLHIARLAVRPEDRGHGVGRALMMALEERARTLNRDRLRLGVRIALPQNRAYYERLGYRYSGVGEHPGLAEPFWTWLEKTL